MNGTIAYALSKQYVSDTADSLGSLKGAPATIKSITEVEGGQKVTFEWTGTSGTKQTSEMTVKNGVSITSIDIDADNYLVCTMSDGTEQKAKIDLLDNVYTKTETDNLLKDKAEKTHNHDDVYAAKDKEHEHSNKETLDKFGVNDGGKLTFDGDVVTPEAMDLGDYLKKTDAQSTYVAKETGKGLSTNDYTTEEKEKLAGLENYNDTQINADISALSTRVKTVEDDYVKSADLPSLSGYATETWVNEQGYLTEHQDISGKVDKVDGKSLIADTEIERLASVDNYDDTLVKSQIQAVANGLMDSVGYSADYKTIDIIAKNGVKKSVNVAPIISHASITELSDVDTTNKATGKALVYNATTSKHEYADVSGTDEKVKMDASTDAKYLGELLDNVTIANENGELKVKKLDGQEVTITEINYLKGLTMNVMDLVNMFSNGGVKIINTPVATYAELLTLDKSSFIDGISYLVYVLADENHDNAKTTYLVDKDSETPTYFGFADSQRDFTTNPIDLATEITGKLGISNMDSDAIKALFTVDDTYKTETATNNAFSTHGAKALYDELLLAISSKANDSDFTAHKDDTGIHVSTTEKNSWNGKADASELTAHTDNTDIHVTTDDKTAWNKVTDKVDKIEGKGLSTNDYTNEEKALVATIGDKVDNSDLSQLEFGTDSGAKNLFKPIFINAWQCTCTIDEDDKITLISTGTSGVSYARIGTLELKGNTTYTFNLIDNSGNLTNIALFTDNTTVVKYITESNITYIPSEDMSVTLCAYVTIGSGNTASFKLMVTTDGVHTVYEPYIPSVKMLAEENEQQNTEAMDLKMLGWTVPSECPVQNHVDGDGVFHQRVGRVDLGSLDWTYDTLWKATSGVSNIKIFTVNMYHSVYVPTIANVSDMPTNSVKKADSGTLWINNGSSTEKPSGYLYFELATEKTIKVDGNEAVTKVNDSLSVIGKCKNLLKPTLKTTEKNGVTCTRNVDANGKPDGTYTLNGMATANADFTFFDNLEKYQHLKNRTVKLVGCPKGGSDTTYRLMLQLQKAPWPSAIDIGKGSSVTVDNNDNWACWIRIYKDATVSNLTFKPMLVFDDKTPNATYDDFVPYTGDGETLTHDVAELKNDLSPKKIELQNVDERVTIQDNGSFIINGFAFVNLLVTFNETLQQWSNFVRLPRPKGGNVTVYCENSVRLTIYSQDNLPGDCGTYDVVQSGTEIRLLVNYEVA